jgi:hypothetical protein
MAETCVWRAARRFACGPGIRDDELMLISELPYQYDLSKCDPALRDSTGAFRGDDWTSISDIGGTYNGVGLTLPAYLDVEARHLSVVASFIEESDPQATFTAEGVQNPFCALPVITRRLENPVAEFVIPEGQVLSVVQALDVYRLMLREYGWCRLDSADRCFIHVGYD